MIIKIKYEQRGLFERACKNNGINFKEISQGYELTNIDPRHPVRPASILSLGYVMAIIERDDEVKEYIKKSRENKELKRDQNHIAE